MSTPSEPLKVALVSRRIHPAHGPGGLERAVHDQAVHLARVGVAVTVISETPSPRRRERAERALADRVDLRWVEPGPLPIGRRRGTVILDRTTNYPIWALRAGQAIGAEFDLAFVHGLGGLGAARRRAAGELPMPLVLGTHGMEEFITPDLLKRAAYAPFRAWMREIAAAADRIVVTDEVLLPRVRDTLGVEEGRLVVIPNAIDGEACRTLADADAAERALGAAASAPLLLVSVGRLAANKGFDLLARALGRAADRLPAGWRWALVGDGRYRPEIEAAIAAAKLGDSAVLLGAVDEATKHGLLTRADWLVHPTRFEGSSLVTLEAMSHGLPVLATRAGGIPDKVVDGESGILVPVDDVEALTSALCSLSSRDPVAMGAAGRRLLDEHFSWPAIARRHLALYRELVGRGAGNSGRAC